MATGDNNKILGGFFGLSNKGYYRAKAVTGDGYPLGIKATAKLLLGLPGV